MGTSSPSAGPPSRSRPSGSIGVLLLAVGLLGHVYAAHATGGSRIIGAVQGFPQGSPRSSHGPLPDERR